MLDFKATNKQEKSSLEYFYETYFHFFPQCAYTLLLTGKGQKSKLCFLDFLEYLKSFDVICVTETYTDNSIQLN